MGGESRRTLGDYFTLQRGTTYKSQLLGLPGPVLLGLATIGRNGGFRRDSLRTYGGESPAQLLVHPGELYVSLKDVTQSADLLGAVARLPFDHEPGRLTQDTVKLVPRTDDVDLGYIHWLLRTPQYREYCRAHATGTTNLGLARDDFLAFEVPEYTAARQVIVQTLSTLDDKIELNRRMNETLEAMARALFKSWFVDFDPVRAKAEGRTPSGMDAETAKLFPSEFVDSELGPIPKGWRRTVLSEAAELNPKRALKKGALAPYVEMSSLPTSGHRPSQWPMRPVGSGARFQNGDTLLARITPCLENGKTAFVDFLGEGEVGWGSTEYIVIAPRAPLPAEWGYLLARDETFRDFAKQKMEGSTGRQRVPAGALGQYLVTVPPAHVAARFGQIVRSWFQRMARGYEESSTLARLRDELLPRLLSGELPVDAAERVVEEVA